MPRINGRYYPAKIYHNSEWVLIAERIYHNGEWVKIDYLETIISMTSLPHGSFYGNTVKALITTGSTLLA